MKTRNFILTALTTLVLTALAGCSSETDLTRTDDVSPLIPEGMTQLSIDIKGVRSGTSYVALTKDEAQLKDLYVALFPQSESGPMPDAVCVAALKANITTKDGVYKAAVLMDNTVPAGKYYAALIANFDAMIAEVRPNIEEIFATFKGKTYAVFAQNMGSQDRGHNTPPVADYGLGMKALVKDIIVSETDRGGVIRLKATMTRQLARFDIKNTAYNSFTITAYKKVNTRYRNNLCFLDTDVPDWSVGVNTHPDLITLTEAQKTLLNMPSLDDDGDPDTPLVMTYNPAFYCLPGLADDQSAVEITGELKVSTGGTRTVTYTIPLKTSKTDEYIAIQSNKRYKIELKMSESEQLVGDVSMDPGSWDDEGGSSTGDDNIEEKLPGEFIAITGATYDEATKTFNVAEGVTTFSFTFIVSANTLRRGSGIVNTVEETTTLVSPSTKYTVMLQPASSGKSGTIEEIGIDKEGKTAIVNTYKVKRAGAPVAPDDVRGHKPVLVDNLWFVDPSAEGKDDEEIGSVAEAAAMCPDGWRLPTVSEMLYILTTDNVTVNSNGDSKEFTVNKNTNFVTLMKRNGPFLLDGSAINSTVNWGVYIYDSGTAFMGNELGSNLARCVKSAE